MVCTYYTGSPGRLADGTAYHQRGLFCASRRFPLGARLLLTERGGRRVLVTVRDRTARGRQNCDLCTRAFRHLAGPHYRVIGVLRGVRVRRVK